MNIPEQVKVGGMIYNVKIVPADEFDGKTGAYIQAEKRAIRILDSDRQFMQQAFLHELFHAMNMEFEETTVEFFAQSLFQIIVDNPQLFVEEKRKRGDKHGKKK